MRLKNASDGLSAMELSAPPRWTGLLWLVPVVSIGDVLWAISAKAGLPLTFGLGLYKWEMIHVIIQVSLIVALSLFFVFLSPSGEEVEVVEVMHAGGLEEERRDG
jgi:uncharacterized membrane protein YcfT